MLFRHVGEVKVLGWSSLEYTNLTFWSIKLTLKVKQSLAHALHIVFCQFNRPFFRLIFNISSFPHWFWYQLWWELCGEYTQTAATWGRSFLKVTSIIWWRTVNHPWCSYCGRSDCDHDYTRLGMSLESVRKVEKSKTFISVFSSIFITRHCGTLCKPRR